MPLGFSTVSFGSTAAPFAPFVLSFFALSCLASAVAPAKSAGDIPISDNMFRLLIFMDDLSPSE
jgi:hypothetical protein